MQGVVEHGTGWYAKRLHRPVAGKTGTTQDQRDLLFIGFSPDLVCGVWVGYDDFRPLKKGLTASSVAVPLWTDFMREALKNDPIKEFPIPNKIEFAKVDAVTGYLALPTCPKVILEAFREGTVPQEFCPYDHMGEQATEEPFDE
jgi:penicillin-binding protein 1A